MREETDMSEDDETGERARWAPDLSNNRSDYPDAGPGPPIGDSPPPFSDQVLENVLENVLEFLTSRRDRNAASAVCHSWYRAEAQTRRELFIGNCYSVSPQRALQRFHSFKSLVLKGKPRFADFNLVPYGWGANFSPWVHSLGLTHSFLERICLKRMTIADDDLTHIATSFPLFKDLSLICCEGFSTLGLAVIAEKCRHLRVLDLIEDYVEDEEDEVVDWISKFPPTTTTLESLVFDCVGCPFNFDALESLVARSPNLRRLRVNQHVTLEQLRRLMMRAPQLSHLGTGAFKSEPGVGQVEPNLDLGAAFANSRALVCLSGFREIDSEFLPAMYPVCANLTSLNFSFASLSAEELKPVIRQCHNLQTFWVLDTVGDEGLQAVSETCKNLRELRVFPLDTTEDSDGSVSDIGLQLISQGCPKLRSILYFCQRMTNQSVIAMSLNCPDLVVFRLCIMGRKMPDRLTNKPMDEGFGAIVKNCKKLTRLSVSGLLTDKAFEYIGTYGKLIRTLSIAFAGDSDLGLKYVLEGCSKLQKLEIRDCPFGDVALRSGIPFYYNMRFLWMSSCNVSMSGARDVAFNKRDLVVEVIKDENALEEEFENEMELEGAVEKLYLYRSLAGPRTDAPKFVKIL